MSLVALFFWREALASTLVDTRLFILKLAFTNPYLSCLIPTFYKMKSNPKVDCFWSKYMQYKNYFAKQKFFSFIPEILFLGFLETQENRLDGTNLYTERNLKTQCLKNKFRGSFLLVKPTYMTRCFLDWNVLTVP